MAKQITPVQIWVSGQEKEATYLGLVSIYDDLESTATFYYQLYEQALDEEGNPILGASITTGNLTMSGQDYQDWGNQSGSSINEWAYNWAATQLNLTIV